MSKSSDHRDTWTPPASQPQKPAAAAPAPNTPAIQPFQSKTPQPGAYERFLKSMVMDYEKWHDGTGYDLQALSEMTEVERKKAEEMLINNDPRDWRDIEALAQFDSPRARQVVEEGLKSSNIQVRQEAMRHIPQKVDSTQRETLLIKALQSNDLYGGLSQAIDEAAEFHPPAIVEALIKGALDRSPEAAIHFAALLFYIHGKADEPFDWNHRPFFLRFDAPTRAERIQVFREMCQIIGVDAGKYVRSE